MATRTRSLAPKIFSGRVKKLALERAANPAEAPTPVLRKLRRLTSGLLDSFDIASSLPHPLSDEAQPCGSLLLCGIFLVGPCYIGLFIIAMVNKNPVAEKQRLAL